MPGTIRPEHDGEAVGYTIRLDVYEVFTTRQSYPELLNAILNILDISTEG
jgi:hypothetical protein